MNGQYRHAEAFCLMTYRSDDGSEEEVIWNSRDGVTPFCITLRSGKEARHVDWRNDRRVLDYRPPVGSRIFVDMTPEVYTASLRANFASDTSYGQMARERFPDAEAFIAFMPGPTAGSPALVEAPT